MEALVSLFLSQGTTLFAVIFTAISGGYGRLVRRNLDKRVVAWLRKIW